MIIAPGDTLVYATSAAIEAANARGEGMISLKHYDLVAASGKKDLTDIDLADVRDACAGSASAAVCFNRSFPTRIPYGPFPGHGPCRGPQGQPELWRVRVPADGAGAPRAPALACSTRVREPGEIRDTRYARTRT